MLDKTVFLRRCGTLCNPCDSKRPLPWNVNSKKPDNLVN
jgi:hypothetical protein